MAAPGPAVPSPLPRDPALPGLRTAPSRGQQRDHVLQLMRPGKECTASANCVTVTWVRGPRVPSIQLVDSENVIISSS